MENDVVDYIIQGKSMYGNDIDNIKMKNSNKKWICQYPTKIVTIQIKLKQATRLNRIQIRAVQICTIKLQFFDIDGDLVHNTQIQCKEKDYNRSLNLVISSAIYQVKAVIQTIDGKQRYLGLNYLMLRGSTDLLKTNHKQVKKNFTKEQQIKIEKFQPNIKSKPVAPSQPYKNLAMNARRDHQIRLRVPTKIPPKQQKKKPQQKNQQIEIDGEFEHWKDDSNTVPLKPQRKYLVAPLSELKQSLRFVNAKWLEAQRKAEEEYEVAEQERISNLVRFK